MAMPTALTILIVVGMMAGSMMHFAQTGFRMATRWRAQDQCLLAAQAAIEAAKFGINEQFKGFFTDQVQSGQSVSWFDTLEWFDEPELPPKNRIGPAGYRYTLPSDTNIFGATVSVTVTEVRTNESVYYVSKDIVMVASSRLDNVSRVIEEVVRYGLEMSRIFDYSYFINNFGWFWGSGVTSHGDVRANGNMSLNDRATVNGDAFAAPNSEIGAAGIVSMSGGLWRNWSRDKYMADAPEYARPLNPPNTGTNRIVWPMGYDTNTTAHSYYHELDMPFLGDLKTYEIFASNYNGRIRQDFGAGLETIVSNVYSGFGPDGTNGTPDDGTMILIGTEDEPVHVDGPVVIEGDVIIRGYFTGQGCIYAGRNIHIAGDVLYQDPPVWTKPDDDPTQTATINSAKDLVGFVAKGNVIMGDYTTKTWRNRTSNYIKPSFTHGYATDPSDYHLGYDSDWNTNNGYYFNGNYTAYDGGYKDDGWGSPTPRRFYESSISDALFSSLAQQYIDRIDGIFYNNHLLSGTVDDYEVNGSLVARDEAIIYSTKVVMNWDIRLGSRSREFIPNFVYFPQTLRMAETVRWREIP
jgi:hypothetical protein